MQENNTSSLVIASEGSSLADVRPTVEQYQEINQSLVFDLSSKDGLKQAKSHIAMLRRVKKPIDDLHKSETILLREAKDAKDKDRRELIAIVDDMIKFHNEPVQKVKAEAAEAKRKEQIEKEIAACWDEAHSLNQIWDSQKEIREEKERLAAQKAEQDRKEREAEIARKAAEDAKEVERARAERERVAREKKEQQAREDKENQRIVNTLILNRISGRCVTDSAAKSIVRDIRDGKIPHVSINYSRP